MYGTEQSCGTKAVDVVDTILAVDVCTLGVCFIRRASVGCPSDILGLAVELEVVAKTVQLSKSRPFSTAVLIVIIQK